MINKRKENNGITLIALVITIIALLILAGISIAMLSSENGVINRSQEAKLADTIGTFNEQVRLAQMNAKTSITAKMTSKPGYIATEMDTNQNPQNLIDLATEVAKGLGLNETIEGSTSNASEPTKKINTEGYTVAYYLDTPGNESTNGEGYIAIWYTSNGFRSTLKDRDNAIKKYNLTETISNSSNQAEETKNKSRNQAVLVAIIQVENYTCNLSVTIGLASTTNGTSDIGKGTFSETTLNGKLGFTSNRTGNSAVTPVQTTVGTTLPAGTYTEGQKVTLGTGDDAEDFFVIGDDGDSVRLLAQYCLNQAGTKQVNADFKTYGRRFSSTDYWSSDYNKSPFDLQTTAMLKKIPSGDTASNNAIIAAQSYGTSKGVTGRLMKYEEADTISTYGTNTMKHILYGTWTEEEEKTLGARPTENWLGFWMGAANTKSSVHIVYGANSWFSHYDYDKTYLRCSPGFDCFKVIIVSFS